MEKLGKNKIEKQDYDKVVEIIINSIQNMYLKKIEDLKLTLEERNGAVKNWVSDCLAPALAGLDTESTFEFTIKASKLEINAEDRSFLIEKEQSIPNISPKNYYSK